MDGSYGNLRKKVNTVLTRLWFTQSCFLCKLQVTAGNTPFPQSAISALASFFRLSIFYCSWFTKHTSEPQKWSLQCSCAKAACLWPFTSKDLQSGEEKLSGKSLALPKNFPEASGKEEIKPRCYNITWCCAVLFFQLKMKKPGHMWKHLPCHASN